MNGSQECRHQIIVVPGKKEFFVEEEKRPTKDKVKLPIVSTLLFSTRQGFSVFLPFFQYPLPSGTELEFAYCNSF